MDCTPRGFGGRTGGGRPGDIACVRWSVRRGGREPDEVPVRLGGDTQVFAFLVVSDEWRKVEAVRVDGFCQGCRTVAPGLEPPVPAKDEVEELSHDFAREMTRRKVYLGFKILDGHCQASVESYWGVRASVYL